VKKVKAKTGIYVIYSLAFSKMSILNWENACQT